MRSNNPDILTIFKLLIVFFITVSPPKKVTQTLLSIKVHLQKERQRQREKERERQESKKESFLLSKFSNLHCWVAFLSY